MATGAAANKTSPEEKHVIFVDDGDVILDLATGESLRASSAVLSLASPVFKKMLGPHYLEGQASRSAEQPKHIELVDDEFAAMKLLLQLMHFQKPPTADITASNLNHYADAVDKWDCADTLFGQ